MHSKIFLFVLLPPVLLPKLNPFFLHVVYNFNLYKGFCSFLNSVVLVQLIISLCALSSCLDVYHSRIDLSISMSHNISKIHVPHSLVHCTRGIFLFLHLSLCLSFSSFAIEIILNQFPWIILHRDVFCSSLPPTLVSYSITKLGIFLSLFSLLDCFEYRYT